MAHAHSHSGDLEKLSIWRLLFRVVLAVLIVGLLVAYSMCFQVPEGYQAVVTRFDKPVGPVRDEAGLYWKWPWPIEQARQIDVRRCLHNTPYTATFTKDRKNVVLLTYVVWHVEDPLLFLQSVGNRKDAEQKLNDMVLHRKNFYLGRYELSDLVSTDPGAIKTDQIEAAMLADVDKDARAKFGIRVEQVGVKRIAYPEENMAAVLDQMREERRAEAGALRAQGEKIAKQITQDALAQSETILSEGREQAGKIRGGAESRAAQIYSEATRLDPEFFTFWRKLLAVKRTLDEKSMLILRTDQSIFDVLRTAPEPPGTRPPADETSATAPSATEQTP